MKILITESQFKNILDDYFSRVITSPEYDFVDSIEIIEGTTITYGSWKIECPYYQYVIHMNRKEFGEKFEKSISNLYDRIDDTHAILFPPNDDGSARAYYSISTNYD